MRPRILVPLAAALIALQLSAPGAPGQTTSSAPGAIPVAVPVAVPASGSVAAPADTTAPASATAPTTAPPTVQTAATTTTMATTTTTIAVRREVHIVGHGYGHGRGLGQWGAYGYATEKGWDYRAILAHYYSNTVPGKVAPQSAVGVRLTAMEGKVLSVYHERGRLTTTSADGQVLLPPAPAGPVAVASGPVSTISFVNSADGRVMSIPDPRYVAATTTLPAARIGSTGGPAVVRIKLTGPGTFSISDGPSCSGPWTERPQVATVGVLVSVGPKQGDPAAVSAEAPGAEDDPSQLLQICDGATRRVYRGDLLAVDGQPGQRTVNQVSLDAYLRSVVPAEVPRGWGATLKGMEAVKAQAVAARSYAAVERRTGFSNTCDTTACQVYKGRGEYRGTSFTSYEDAKTDRAVFDTANEVRVDPVSGAPVRTEFSSSTGGHTAGGIHPAVADEGDAVSANPHHNWVVRIPASRLENGRNLGVLTAIEVSKRDPEGGRAAELRLTFAKGTATMTGADLASRLGLKSRLYTPTLQLVPVSAPTEADATVPVQVAATLGEGRTAAAEDTSPATPSGAAASGATAATPATTATPVTSTAPRATTKTGTASGAGTTVPKKQRDVRRPLKVTTTTVVVTVPNKVTSVK